MLAASALAATLPTPSKKPPPPPRAAATASTAGTGAARVADERQLGLHLGVLRKAERHRRIDRAARRVESVRVRASCADAMSLPSRTRYSVKSTSTRSPRDAGNLEAPQHRPRERVTHRLCFSGVRRQGAELIVRLHHEDARAGAFELDDAGAGEDAAIEADVVRAEASGESSRIQDFRVEFGNLEPQLAAGFIQIDRIKPVNLLQPVCAFFNRRDLICGWLPPALTALTALAALTALPACLPWAKLDAGAVASAIRHTNTLQLQTLNMRILPLPREVYQHSAFDRLRRGVRRWVLFCPVRGGRPRRRHRGRRA